jgi:transcription antitermination protein NusB
MLNRRTLRIKIMQSLFAFDQCKEANYQLSLDQIEEHFLPDLNSMEVQDKELLKSRRKSARQLLEKKFMDEKTEDTDDKKVNDTAKASLSLYHKQVKKDLNFFSKNMVVEVEKINDLYFSILGLLMAFSELAAADKKSNFKNYHEHLWIKSLQTNHELKTSLTKNNTGWPHRMDLVRGWFRDVLKPDGEFQKFNELKSPSLEDQKALLKHLVRKVILGKSIIQDYYEEEDIRWAEDKDIVKSLVDKTFKTLNEESGTMELQKLSLDWDDDLEFMEKLFKDAAALSVSHKELIAANTKNWEVDRLPLTDRIILEMAIAELIGFPNIPVKVSINEYIELAKLYSTPKSRQFINGILDVIAKELQDKGEIRKSGRGLIDNK